jgi:hypothetical protein
VFATLSDWASAMQQEWSDQLRAFKAHAERSVRAPARRKVVT